LGRAVTAVKPEWVEAGARALMAGKHYGGWAPDEPMWQVVTPIAEKVIAAVAPLIAEEIARAIEAECPHGHVVGDKQVCYRCEGAAAIARRIGGTP
jgi:hypothetical protein